MVPFSMKCLQCLEYISARRKFNARKEITSEKYMEIKIIRFHIKCPRCNQTLLFQTDPKSAGFIPVSGCARNYESLTISETIKPLETEDEIFERLERQEKENQQFQEQQKKRKNNPFWLRHTQDTSKDAMSNLEDKLIEQKREQEIHDHLMYLQAKATKLQQSGGEDQLINHATEKLRLDLKRDREPEIKPSELGLASISKSEPKAKLTVPGSFTVKKPKLMKGSANDPGHVTKIKSPSKVDISTPNTENIVSKAPATNSVFGDYESSDEEE